MRAVAEMRGEGRAGADRILNLLRRRAGVSDAGDHALLRQSFDVARRLGPLRRKSDQANVAAGGFLPTVKFVEIGRAHGGKGMRSTWAFRRGDVGTFDVERLHCCKFMCMKFV